MKDVLIVISLTFPAMQNMDDIIFFSCLLLSVFCYETLIFMTNKLLPKTPNIYIIET